HGRLPGDVGHGGRLQYRHRPHLSHRRSAHRSFSMNANVRRFLSNPKAIIGLSIILIVVLAAFLAPVLFPRSPWDMVSRPFLPPFQDGRYWLGTDMLGRDIFAGLAHGAQVSLIVGFVSTLVARGVGILF